MTLGDFLCSDGNTRKQRWGQRGDFEPRTLVDGVGGATLGSAFFTSFPYYLSILFTIVSKRYLHQEHTQSAPYSSVECSTPYATVQNKVLGLNNRFERTDNRDSVSN